MSTSHLSRPASATRRWLATIHPEAPAKPAPGAPCNGCGLCCLAEPCPVGMLVSRRRHGACAALRWVGKETGPARAAMGGAGAYRCGLIAAPDEYMPAWLQRHLPTIGRVLSSQLGCVARRLISAGSGCDADLLVDDADVPPAGPAGSPAEPGR